VIGEGVGASRRGRNAKLGLGRGGNEFPDVVERVGDVDTDDDDSELRFAGIDVKFKLGDRDGTGGKSCIGADDVGES
jgi:hypothetical protein